MLYTGVTNDLLRRISEHKIKQTDGFTAKYQVNRLVYYEVTDSIESAIDREKQLKGGSRKTKLALINEFNPNWTDLSEDLLN